MESESTRSLRLTDLRGCDCRGNRGLHGVGDGGCDGGFEGHGRRRSDGWERRHRLVARFTRGTRGRIRGGERGGTGGGLNRRYCRWCCRWRRCDW